MSRCVTYGKWHRSQCRCSRYLQYFAASLKEGGYTSAQTYFQAIFSHQRRTLQMEVLQIIKHTAKDYARSIGRSLGPAALKDSFDVELLATIPVDFTETPFRFSDPRHRKDILVVGCWFMLRELELAACRWAHVYVENGSLHVLVLVQKNDTAGALTVRSLLCACRSRYKGEDIILLSFCDGVASARLALQLLVGTPRMSVAWETDPECMKDTQTSFRGATS